MRIMQDETAIGPFGRPAIVDLGAVALEMPLYATDAIGTGTMTQRAIDGASELVIGLMRSAVKL